MNRDYCWRVTYTYFMKDGVCCEPVAGSTQYRFTVKPYAERRFKTVDNAVRTLQREGFVKIPAYKGPSLMKEHICTGNSPAVASYPVYATVE